MRDEYTPGDLSVRIGFSRYYGKDSEEEVTVPTIEIADQTSGKVLRLKLTAAQLTEMLSGPTVQVAAADVDGFNGLAQWGRYLKTVQRTVSTRIGDYKAEKPEELPYVAEVIAEIEADGYRADRPRRNNAQQWVIFGRRYDETPG